MLSQAVWLKMADINSRIVNIPTLCAKMCTDSQLTRIAMSTYGKKWATQTWCKPYITRSVVKYLDQRKIHPEFIRNLGPSGFKWLAAFVSTCMRLNLLPKLWRKANIIAILKPGKDAKVPKSYRPISLLCVPLSHLKSWNEWFSVASPLTLKNA